MLMCGPYTPQLAYERGVTIMIDLPKPFRFLGIGWIIVHVIAISLVFYLGHVLWK